MTATVTELRVPPHSVPAEQAVLGALLIDPRAWYAVADQVTEADFYRSAHRAIFSAIRAQAEAGKPFDLVTVGEALEAAGTLADAGGLRYLADLANNVPSSINAASYATIVRDHAARRALLALSVEIGDAVHAGQADAAALLTEAGERLQRLTDHAAAKRSTFRDPRELLRNAVNKIETAYASGEPLTGLPTGFGDLDAVTAGLQPGNLVVLAARPGLGKTGLALNIADHAAAAGNVVAFFSLEMSADELTLRRLAARSGLDLGRLMRGALQGNEWDRLTAAIADLTDAPLWIDDSAALSALDVHARCRRLQRERGRLDLVCVDYLELLAGEGETQTLKIGALAASMKRLAKELRVPVLLLAQLNRALENRNDKRPTLADLRDSGEIEQHADLVAFVYRDEVYHRDTPDKGTAELIIAKHRNGPTGTVRLAFDGPRVQFRDLARDARNVNPLEA